VRPGVQVFIYPEELEASTADALVERVLELGCDAASMAVVYHRARRVLPRQRRVSTLRETTTYFAPDPTCYGALVPVGNGPPHLRDRLHEFREACGRAGLLFRAWIVALHQDGLAAGYPDSAARMLDGSVGSVGLCPSQTETVKFVAGLVSDVCTQLSPDAAELEAALYPAWEPSYTLTLAPEPLGVAARLLGAQCFCPACRALLGDRADEIERRARDAAGPPFGDGDWDEELAAELAAARARGVRRLVEAASAAASRCGSALRVFGSGPPEQARLQGLSSAAVDAADGLLFGCGPLAGDELLQRFESLRGLVGSRTATASINWTPERSPESMAADAERLAAAGADGLALYNLTLVSEPGLVALGAAAAAFRAATRSDGR